MTSYQVNAIGRVESVLTDLDSAPRQADEGAPTVVRIPSACTAWR